MGGGLASVITKTWQTSWRPNLLLATLHVRYCQKIFQACHCRVAEEALPGKLCFEHQPVWVLNRSLYDQQGLEAEKARCISFYRVQVRYSHQPRYTEFIQLNAMNSHYEFAREYKCAGIPLQHHLGLLPELGAVLVQIASSMIRKKMACGIPQGSVLGPLLWNIASDETLKEDAQLGVSIICYTNDTLMVQQKTIFPCLSGR